MEYLDYFDAQHRLLGKKEKVEIHKNALWHHTFHCWIFTSKGEIIFQLRAKNIVANPNVLDISSAGHIEAGEDPLAGGLRELNEELGLNVGLNDLIRLGIFQHASDALYPDGSPNQNREFCYTYLLKSDKPLDQYRLQKEELGGIYTIPLVDLFKIFTQEVKQIQISGLAFQDSGELKSEIKTVSLKDFNPEFLPEHYIKIGIMVERALEGKKYFGV